MAKKKPVHATPPATSDPTPISVPAFLGGCLATAAVVASLMYYCLYLPEKRDNDRLKENPAPLAVVEHQGPPAAGVLVVRQMKGRRLMLMVVQEGEEDKNRLVFSPPAGGIDVEEGEQASEAAIREAGQETGLSVKEFGETWKADEGNLNFHLVHCILSDGPIAEPTTNETIGFTWVDPTLLPVKYWRFPEQRNWLISCYEKALVAQFTDGTP